MSEQADVVVIGGGVIGASIALEFARTGRDVLVVEKLKDVGGGSTSYSSAVVRFHYSTLDGVLTAWESKFRWERWAEHLDAQPDEHLARFISTGAVILDSPDNAMERCLPHLRAVGVPCERWSTQDIRTRLPLLDPGAFGPPKNVRSEDFWADAHGELGAYFMPDAGFVDDPQLAARNLMDAAKRLGARVRLGTEVVEISRTDHCITGVRLADGTAVSVPVVVNAAGPYSAKVNDMAGVLADFRIGTRAMRQEVHSVRSPAGYSQNESFAPIIIDQDLGTYFRPHFNDTIIIGGTEPECDPLVWVDEPDEYKTAATQEVFDAQVLRVARRIPSLSVPTRATGIVGLYDVSDDWAPIYDRTSLDGYYVAIGTSGNQFKNAPLVGSLIRELVDEVDKGADHDRDPVTFACQHVAGRINLGTYSRLRVPNPNSPMNANG